MSRPAALVSQEAQRALSALLRARRSGDLLAVKLAAAGAKDALGQTKAEMPARSPGGGVKGEAK